MAFIQVAEKAARKAGELVRKDFFSLIEVFSKGSHDVVTQSDLQAEKIILGMIKKEYPSHSIVSEEEGARQKSFDYCWYVDPIDGTSNFVTGNPYFAISIALAYKQEIIAGVVYNPVLDEIYVGEKGGGAFLNGWKLSVSSRSLLSEALVACSYAAGEDDIRSGVCMLEKLALQCQRVVVNFAPALDLCNIARGRIDALVDNGSTVEDHAAASLILTEAGGTVQNIHTSSWDVRTTGIIASNRLLQEKIRNAIS